MIGRLVKHVSVYSFLIFILFSSLPNIAGQEERGNKKRRKPVIITGNRITSRLIGTINGVKKYLTELTGNPRISTGKIRIRTNRIIVHGTNGDTAECRGNVVLIDRKSGSVMRSRRAIFHKNDNRVELLGNPRIFTKRKDDNSKVFIKSDRIVYSIDDDIAEASGRVFVKNRDIRINSERALYNKDGARINFYGNPVIHKKKDIFKAEKITYLIDKKRIFLEKDVYIETYSEEKDDKTGATKMVKAITRGDRVERREGDTIVTIIEGNAFIERTDATFKGDRIEIVGEKSEFVEGKNVHIIYNEENIEVFGRRFRYFKNDKYATLWGKPLIIIKDEKTGDERARINGEFMEFYQDIDELYVNGNVAIYHESDIISGDMARYLRKENNMYISGNPKVEREGSTLFADLIIFNSKDYTTKLIGNINGSGIVK